MPKKSQFTEEQIIHALKEVEAGAKPAEVCRRLGVSEQTFYRWKSRFGGMDVSEARLSFVRVAAGGCPPAAPTDPDVQNSRIRLFGTWTRYAGHRVSCGEETLASVAIRSSLAKPT